LTVFSIDCGAEPLGGSERFYREAAALGSRLFTIESAMSPSSVTAVVLALVTLILAARPLAMSVHLNLDSDEPTVQEAMAPPAVERSTIEQLFDTEATRLGLEHHKKSR
jgi:hypothetical protein